MRIDRMDRQLARAPVREQRDQAALLNVRSEREAWTEHYAMSGKSQSMNDSRIRGRERPGNAYRLDASVGRLETPVAPVTDLG